MRTNNYIYDVAFSFMEQDETLALQLNDLLQDQHRTFLYSKKQGEIAGTDGEKTFNLVFGEQSRLVVVLYRDGWGETAWTRIEETAIRNRAYNDGYDFVIFIPLDDKQTVPKWLPRAQLWIGIKRWGINGAASVIEKRINDLGGILHEETVEERAARLERSIKFNEERKNFLNSERGVQAANKEFEILRYALESNIKSIKSNVNSFNLQLKVNGKIILIVGFQKGISIHWKCKYVNSLDGATLEITIWNSHPPYPGIMFYEEPRKLKTIIYKFDLLPTNNFLWVADTSTRHTYNTNDMASFILKYFMDNVSEIK